MERRGGLKIMLSLIGLVKPLAIYMLCAVLLGVAGFICATGIPVLGAALAAANCGFDIAINKKYAIGVLAAFAVLRGILRYGEQACNHYIAFRLLALIRDKVFGALRRLSPAKLEVKEKGDLISLITSDVELLEVFYAHTISPVIIAVISSAVFTLFIARISAVLAIIASAAYILIGAVAPIINGGRVKSDGMEYRKSAGKLNSVFLDSLRGMRQILQYDCAEQKQREIIAATDKLAALQKSLKKSEIKNANFTEICVFALNTIMLFAAAKLYLSGNISFAEAVIAFVTLVSSYGPVMALNSLSNNLAQTLACGDRVLTLLEEKPQTEDKTDGKNISAGDVDCQNVDFSYGDEKILDNLSVYMPKGKITGIYGKSGCGKSTLLKLIMRFWDKDGGKILINGEDVSDINTASLRQNESYCTQDTHLFNDTIANNIRVAKLNATDEEIREAAKSAAIHSFIQALPQGYNTPIGELGGRLSSGEKQRIGIARAFISSADIMLLDEPTSNLDALNEGIILKSLQEARGKTIALVSHRKSTLNIAEKTYNLDNGRLS